MGEGSYVEKGKHVKWAVVMGMGTLAKSEAVARWWMKKIGLGLDHVKLVIRCSEYGYGFTLGA